MQKQRLTAACQQANEGQVLWFFNLFISVWLLWTVVGGAAAVTTLPPGLQLKPFQSYKFTYDILKLRYMQPRQTKTWDFCLYTCWAYTQKTFYELCARESLCLLSRGVISRITPVRRYQGVYMTLLHLHAIRSWLVEIDIWITVFASHINNYVFQFLWKVVTEVGRTWQTRNSQWWHLT